MEVPGDMTTSILQVLNEQKKRELNVSQIEEDLRRTHRLQRKFTTQEVASALVWLSERRHITATVPVRTESADGADTVYRIT